MYRNNYLNSIQQIVCCILHILPYSTILLSCLLSCFPDCIKYITNICKANLDSSDLIFTELILKYTTNIHSIHFHPGITTEYFTLNFRLVWAMLSGILIFQLYVRIFCHLIFVCYTWWLISELFEYSSTFCTTIFTNTHFQLSSIGSYSQILQYLQLFFITIHSWFQYPLLKYACSVLSISILLKLSSSTQSP